MPSWVAIALLMESTNGWRHTAFTGRHPKTIRSPHRSITSEKAVKGSIVSPRVRSRWPFPCVACGNGRLLPLPRYGQLRYADRECGVSRLTIRMEAAKGFYLTRPGRHRQLHARVAARPALPEAVP